MIHELVSIRHHRVQLSTQSDEIVCNPDVDDFFKENMYLNYGELCNNMQKLVEEYKVKTKSSAKVESIEDMMRFMENYSEFRQYAGNVTKHANIVAELKILNDKYHLFDVSEIE